MDPFGYLGARGWLALSLLPLVLLISVVSLIVDRGFTEVEKATAAATQIADLDANFATLERCLAQSQGAMMQYALTRSVQSAEAFQRHVACLKDTAQTAAPELAQSVADYQVAFGTVVDLGLQEAELHQTVIDTGSLAHQTLARILESEAELGRLETVVIAAELKEDVLNNVATLSAPLPDGARPETMALAPKGRSLLREMQVHQTAGLQVLRGQTLVHYLQELDTSIAAVIDVQKQKTASEQRIAGIIVPDIAASIAARTSASRALQSDISADIAGAVTVTRHRIKAVSLVELALSLLIVSLVGGWVSHAVRHMAQLMTRVASGESNVKVPGTGWKNELGEMARALEVFQESARLKTKAEATAKAAQTVAETDPVTGFGNRRAIDKELSILTPDQYATSGLALIDLNAFKPINDNFGHDAGDSVLQEVGRRLDERFHHQGCIARLGGDEFGVLIRNVGQKEALIAAAETILGSFQEPVLHGAEPLNIGASVGLVGLDAFEDDQEGAWKAADSAMFSVKKRRRTGYALYDPDMHKASQEEFRADQIAQALETGAFVPFFQPQFDLKTMELVGLEAVARWWHPQLGLLGPARFLGAIKTYGMIQEFSDHILNSILSSVTFWRKLGLAAPPVTVNVLESYISTDQGLDALLSRMEQAGMSGADIGFQISEAALVSRVAADVQQGISVLHDHGFCIALDHFGTDFGSLRHLQDVPVSELKIGKRLIHEIGTSHESEAIIACIVNLAAGLGRTCVARGVDTQAQRAFLQGIGCKLGQGHVKGPACGAQDIAAVLSAEPSSQSTAAAG